MAQNWVQMMEKASESMDLGSDESKKLGIKDDMKLVLDDGTKLRIQDGAGNLSRPESPSCSKKKRLENAIHKKLGHQDPNTS
eukprot:12589583-Ditylum_brightwellii.AAC.1